jgi:ribonuclease BN (tRNA processing enzyme)
MAGCGDAFGSGGRFQTCLLVDAEQQTLAIDCGTSSLIAMARAGRDPNDIGSVLLTHLHGDHFGGIPYVVLHGQFARREQPLLVVGPPGTEARTVATMEALFPGSSTTKRRFPVTFLELEDRCALTLGPWEVKPFLVDHPCGAPPFAVRVAVDDVVIGYSGDTAWVDNLVDVAEGSDLFLCEAYFYDKAIPGHLSYSTLYDHANQLDTRHLVMTHMSSDMLTQLANTAFDSAQDGRIVSVGSSDAG